MEWSVVEWSTVEWSGVEWSGDGGEAMVLARPGWAYLYNMYNVHNMYNAGALPTLGVSAGAKEKSSTGIKDLSVGSEGATGERKQQHTGTKDQG